MTTGCTNARGGAVVTYVLLTTHDLLARSLFNSERNVDSSTMKPTGKFPVGVAELEYVARGLVLTPETEPKQLDPAKVPPHFLAGTPFACHAWALASLVMCKFLQSPVNRSHQNTAYPYPSTTCNAPWLVKVTPSYVFCSTWWDVCSTHATRSSQPAALPCKGPCRGSQDGRMRRVRC